MPVADDSMTGEHAHVPRPLAAHPRRPAEEGPQDRRRVGGEPKLPTELEGALHSLYGNYEKYYRRGAATPRREARGLTPPVFIVVCNNTNVSKLVFD